MIRAGRYQVGRISTECAVPYPPLVAYQGGLEGKWLWLLVVLVSGLRVVDLPDFSAMIRAARRELLHIRR